MEIIELPFWSMIIMTLLPIVIAILFMFRIIGIIKSLVLSRKKSQPLILDIGRLLIFLVYFAVILNLILYIIGDQPDGFLIFEYLVIDMLPPTIYTILIYGILAQISIAYRRVKVGV